MAITKVADRVTVATNTSTTTFDYVLSGMTVGNTLIMRVAADNTGGGGAARTITVTNQSGTPINTATDLDESYNHDPGAAGAGVTNHIIVAEITATSGTVRITYSGAVTQAGIAEEWSGLQTPPSIVGTVGSTAKTNTTDLGPLGDAIASHVTGNLVYVNSAVEGPGSDTFTADADTSDGVWVELTKAGTSTGSAATECTVYGNYKIVTGTGNQTYNATINNARDSANQMVEIAAGTVTFSKTDPVGITDANRTVVANYARNGHTGAADPLNLTDANRTVAADYVRTPTTDPVGLTDAISAPLAAVRSSTDSMNLVDGIVVDEQEPGGDNYTRSVGQLTLVDSGTLTT